MSQSLGDFKGEGSTDDTVVGAVVETRLSVGVDGGRILGFVFAFDCLATPSPVSSPSSGTSISFAVLRRMAATVLLDNMPRLPVFSSPKTIRLMSLMMRHGDYQSRDDGSGRHQMRHKPFRGQYRQAAAQAAYQDLERISKPNDSGTFINE